MKYKLFDYQKEAVANIPKKAHSLLLKEDLTTELVSLPEHKQFALSLMGALEGDFVWANEKYLITRVAVAQGRVKYHHLLWRINRWESMLTTPGLSFIDGHKNPQFLLDRIQRWWEFSDRNKMEVNRNG